LFLILIINSQFTSLAITDMAIL